MTSLKVGTRLDQYEILASIGAGAMGEVYKAKDIRLDRIVALKVITATRGLDPHARDRFDREARALAALSHPHICNVYHYGEDEGTPYLVMEYLKGQTVAQRLRSDGKLPPADVLRFGVQIAEALHAAHQAGIVHRDLKPENVMLTEAGPKLLDLGVSKRLPEVEDRFHTGTTQLALSAVGTISGTVPYMAPEQLEGHPADVRSDIFSFGAVLYEMATGRRAFEGQSQARIIASIMSQEPVKASSLEPALPVGLDAVLERCLKKTAETRYQTSLEVAAALREIREGAVNGVAPATAPVAVSAGGSADASNSLAPAPLKRRRRLIIRFSIGISFGVLALAFVMQNARFRMPPPSQLATSGAPASPPSIAAPSSSSPAVDPPAAPAVGPPAAPRLPLPRPPGKQQAGPQSVPAPPQPAATAAPPVPSPPRAATAPPVAGPGAAVPAYAIRGGRSATAEERARTEITLLVQQYCSAYETLEVDSVRKLFPRVYLSVLRSQFESYTSLQCTLTGPLTLMVVDAGPNGRASVMYKMRHVIQMKAGGPPRIVDLAGMMTVSRSESAPWTIDAVTEERKEGP